MRHKINRKTKNKQVLFVKKLLFCKKNDLLVTLSHSIVFNQALFFIEESMTLSATHKTDASSRLKIILWFLLLSLLIPATYAQRPKLIPSGKTDLCVGENVIFSLGGKYNWYNWNNGSKAPQTEVKALQTGIIPVYCIVIDENGITQFSDTIIVNVFPRPNVPAVSYSAQEQLLEASSINDLQWFFKGSFGQDSLINGATSRLYRPTKSGYYFAQAVNEFGCVTRSKDIFVCFKPALRVLGNTTFCLGNRIIVEVPVSYPNYEWSTGETEQAIVLEPKEAGIYSVYCTVSGSTCSIRSDVLTIRVLPVPAKPIVEIDRLNGVLVCKTKGVSYSWYRGQNTGIDTVRALNNDSIFHPREEGYYFVVVRNSAGCASVSEPILIRNTPNSLEKNDFMNHQGITIHPNPATENITLRYPVNHDIFKVILTDLAGKKITEKNVMPTGEDSLFVSELPAGVYLLYGFSSDDDVSVLFTKKIIITK